MICTTCKSKNILTRTNYTHGKKSKGRVSHVCRSCGCTRVEAPEPARGRRRTRK